MKTLIIATQNKNELVKVYTGTVAGILCFYRDRNGKFLKTSDQKEFNWLAGQVNGNIETRNEEFLVWDRRDSIQYSDEDGYNSWPGYMGYANHAGKEFSIFSHENSFVVEGPVVVLYFKDKYECHYFNLDKKESINENRDILHKNENRSYKRKIAKKRKIIIRKFSDN